MLTPEFLLRIVEATEEKTAELNNYVAERIAKRIMSLFSKKGKVELIPSSVLDARKAKETGKLTEEVSQIVEEKLPEIKSEVKKAFVKAANQIDADNRLFTQKVVQVELDNGVIQDIELPELSDYEKSGIPKKIKDLNLTQKEVRLLERAYRVTNGTLNNLTRTTALASQRTFIAAVDTAYWKATHGVSIHTAIAEAVEECAKEGAYVLYPTGHRDRIEVAVARAVRTGINQAAGDITLTRCAEMGVNAVIVSSHAGARYTDKDEPANHMSWQGKVYSIDWKSPALSQYEVTEEEREENKGIFKFLDRIRIFLNRHQEKTAGDFIAVTGYGTGEGLCGWNCRHSFGPYYKGISVNDNKPYDSEEDKRKYDLEQEQRAKERKIRELTRKRNVCRHSMKESEDDVLADEFKEKYQKIQKNLDSARDSYEDFCQKNNLKTRQERLKVYQK